MPALPQGPAQKETGRLGVKVGRGFRLSGRASLRPSRPLEPPSTRPLMPTGLTANRVGQGLSRMMRGAVSWKRILIGAGIGFAAGFGILGTWKLPANAENRVSFRGSRQRLVRLIP